MSGGDTLARMGSTAHGPADPRQRAHISTDPFWTWWPLPPACPFALIEMRLDRYGEGEGKISIASGIAVNQRLNVIELEDLRERNDASHVGSQQPCCLVRRCRSMMTLLSVRGAPCAAVTSG